MRLYIKQKVFSIGAKFTVKDEYDNDMFQVQGEVFSLGHKLHIYDMDNNEVALIKQKLFTLFKPRYEIIVNGQLFAEIIKEITFFKDKYTFNGCNWVIDGNVFDYKYTINSSGTPIARIEKKLLSWGDTYEIEVFNDANVVLVLAGVLAIDCVKANNNGG